MRFACIFVALNFLNITTCPPRSGSSCFPGFSCHQHSCSCPCCPCFRFYSQLAESCFCFWFKPSSSEWSPGSQAWPRNFPAWVPASLSSFLSGCPAPCVLCFSNTQQFLWCFTHWAFLSAAPLAGEAHSLFHLATPAHQLRCGSLGRLSRCPVPLLWAQ